MKKALKLNTWGGGREKEEGTDSKGSVHGGGYRLKRFRGWRTLSSRKEHTHPRITVTFSKDRIGWQVGTFPGWGTTMTSQHLVQYLDVQSVCLLLPFHWHIRSLWKSEWMLLEHRNGLRTWEKLSLHCAHTGKHWPGGRLGRYDKGNTGQGARTSHCMLLRPCQEPAFWVEAQRS